MQIIRGVVPSPRRVMLYGPHGVGKGTWASHAPAPFFLDIEGGLDDIDCERTPRLGTYQQVVEWLTWLLNDEHGYKTVVVDTVDWLEQLIHKQIAIDANVKSVADIHYGRGYARSIPAWNWIINQLDQLRNKRKMAIILLSHAKIERYESPESESYDRYSPDLHKSSCSLIQEWCDEVLFANFKVFTKKQDEGFNRSRAIAVGGKERIIRTCESAASLAKNRLNLPAEMPLEWSAYMAAVKAHYASHAKPTSVDISGIVVEGSSKPTSEAYSELEAVAKEVF